MTITNIRDPWVDDVPEILRKDRNYFAAHETAFVQRELGLEGLRVLFNVDRLKFVIQDTKAPGGPASSYVMIVQTPDGMPKDVDQHTIQELRKLYGQSRKDAAEELIRAEKAREARVKHERSERAYGVADALRWIGRAVTPSVAWGKRAQPIDRDAIRKEAGL